MSELKIHQQHKGIRSLTGAFNTTKTKTSTYRPPEP